jgi:ABC-type Fe3+ transport system permease subunit
MNLERGFRRLVVVLSGVVLALGIFMDFGSPKAYELHFTWIAVVLVALLWMGFYAVRWVVRGFKG